MDIEEEEASNCSTLRISDDDALALMSLLMKRGYFHEDVTPVSSAAAIQFNDFHDRNNVNRSSLYVEDDAPLIKTSNHSFIVIDELRKMFKEALQLRGRLVVADAAEFLFVSTEILLRRVVPFMLDHTDQNDKYITITNASGHIKEILLSTYFQEQTKLLFVKLNANVDDGWMPLSDAAKAFYKLPLDITVTQLEKIISSNDESDSNNQVRIMLLDNASKALVTQAYLSTMKQKLTQTLCPNCDVPIDIRTLAKSNKWELNWVKKIIQDGIDVSGEFHGDIYIPRRYVEEKQNLVRTSYDTNGYVTAHMCYTMFDISPSQMKEYVTHHIPEESYVVLPNTVISKDTVVIPLLASALDAMESKHWLDLQLHIPIELLEYETNDVRILIDTYILTKVSGVVCVRPDGALFYSDTMIQHFKKKRLVAIVNTLGVARAMEIFISYRDGDPRNHSDQLKSSAQQRGNEKRNSRKSTKLSSEEELETMLQERGDVPFEKLLQSFTEDYPDLRELESPPDLLMQIWKLAFYADTLEASWCGAVQTELKRLYNDAQASVSINISESSVYLNDFQNIESAFEDPACFATCCYMIQAKAKFVSYAIECGDRISDAMKQEIQRDFFAGCCRDFAYRVTQFTLHRNKVADGVFSYSIEGDDRAIFYSPIDICSNFYNNVRVSCASDGRALPTALKEELPRDVGISLAQTWDFCDSGSDRGAAKSPLNSISDASVNAFVEHLRDNCLTFCGLPFTTYDKKAEKKFLATRRSHLMDRLEKAKSASDALDITITLLYQTVRNLVVSGPLLQGPILDLLLTERKLSESVVEELRTLVSAGDLGSTIDSTMMQRFEALVTSKTKK